MRNTNTAYFPGLRLSDTIELRYIASTILVADIEQKPITASMLARALGYPRATLMRRLAQLMELGYIKRVGRYYYVGPNANLPHVRGMHARNVRMILDTSKELSKMDITA